MATSVSLCVGKCTQVNNFPCVCIDGVSFVFVSSEASLHRVCVLLEVLLNCGINKRKRLAKSFSRRGEGQGGRRSPEEQRQRHGSTRESQKAGCETLGGGIKERWAGRHSLYLSPGLHCHGNKQVHGTSKRVTGSELPADRL